MSRTDELREDDRARRVAKYHAQALRVTGQSPSAVTITVYPEMSRIPKVRGAGRPFVLTDAEDKYVRRDYRWRAFLSIFDGQWPPPRRSSPVASGPEQREKFCRQSLPRDGKPRLGSGYFGRWESRAGTLVEALKPVSRCRVLTFLVVGPERIDVVYMNDDFKRPERTADFAQLGWSLPRHHLAWTREVLVGERTTQYQLGFDDGSWATLAVSSRYGAPAFRAAFPQTLSPSEPIPPA